MTKLQAMLSGRGREIALLVAILGSLFSLVSLLDWHVTDPTLLRPGPGDVENVCGPVGANVADALYAALGWGAWGLVLVVAWCIVAIAGRPLLNAWRSAAATVLYVDALALVELGLRPGEPHPPGGRLGSMVVSGLERFVGTFGAVIVLLGVVLVMATLLFRIDWAVAATWMVEKVEGWMPVVRGWLGIAGAKAMGVAGLGARGAASAARSGAGAAAGQIQGIGARSWGVVRRMFRALTRSGDDDDYDWDDEWDTDDGSSVLDSFPPELATDTVVGGPVALVEAEWDPTSEPGGTRTQDDLLEMFPAFTPRVSDAGTGLSMVSSSSGGALRPAPVAQVEFDEDDLTPAHGTTPPDMHEPSIAYSQGSQPSVHVEPARVVQPKNKADNVVVHEARFLEEEAEDDGKALAKKDRWAHFELPALALLDQAPRQKTAFDENELRELAVKLQETLENFRIKGEVTGIRPGPVVTTFEFLPEPGIKVSRIAALEDDVAMALRALRVRIVAPIPGKGVVGIEIPSQRRLTIYLRELMANEAFRKHGGQIPMVIGKDVEGQPVVGDLAKMPHLLVGGTTGSGKSVGVNGMLMSMLFTKTPDELRLLLVDPKMLEFEMYNDIPHLLHPVVTDPKIASQALNWACREMDDRYELLARWGTRNIVSYNKKVEREAKDWNAAKARKYAPKGWVPEDGPIAKPEKLPYIVIIIDELADLMMVAKGEVEEAICRIAQKARACGIHLIVATQRPSVDVVTGLIKANLPTRISFQLRSATDSKTILDGKGAESLLGRGDMLYLPPGVGGLQRVHGAFVSDEEVGRVTDHLREQSEPCFIETLEEPASAEGGLLDEELDELYDEAVQIVLSAGKASTSMIQRHLKIGYNRAARIIDAMEAQGVIGPADGARPREVLGT